MRNKRARRRLIHTIGVFITLLATLVAFAQVAALAAVEDPGKDFGVCDGELWVKWQASGTTWEYSDDWIGDPPEVTVEVLEYTESEPWMVEWTSSELAAVLVGVKSSGDVAEWPGGYSGTVTGWTEVTDDQTIDHAISFIVWCFDLDSEVSVTKVVEDPDGLWTGELFGLTLTGDETTMFDLDDGQTFTDEFAVGQTLVLTEHEARDADETTMTVAVDGGDPVAYTGTEILIEPGHTYAFVVTNTFEPELVVLPADIELVKTADPVSVEFNDTSPTSVVVTYTYTVTNTGEVPLVDVVVYDETLEQEVVLPVTTLAPGESTFGTLELTVTADDVGVLDNVAIATASTEDGRDVDDTDDATVTVTVVSPNVIESASITVVKTPDVTSIAYDAADGNDEVITYTYVITNTGDVTLYDITLVDDMLGTITLPKTTLAPDEVMTVTATYVLKAGDVGKAITNVVVVEGDTLDGRTVTDNDDAVVDVTEVKGVKIEDKDLPKTGAAMVPLLLAGLLSIATGSTLVRRTR
jgi:uncharacterized repeat protein (TIGR01451 family)/LPXTG-motif cell wall-anchored protein